MSKMTYAEILRRAAVRGPWSTKRSRAVDSEIRNAQGDCPILAAARPDYPFSDEYVAGKLIGLTNEQIDCLVVAADYCVDNALRLRMERALLGEASA